MMSLLIERRLNLKEGTNSTSCSVSVLDIITVPANDAGAFVLSGKFTDKLLLVCMIERGLSDNTYDQRCQCQLPN